MSPCVNIFLVYMSLVVLEQQWSTSTANKLHQALNWQVIPWSHLSFNASIKTLSFRQHIVLFMDLYSKQRCPTFKQIYIKLTVPNRVRKHSLWATLPLTPKWTTTTTKSEVPLQVASSFANFPLRFCVLLVAHLQWFMYVPSWGLAHILYLFLDVSFRLEVGLVAMTS